MDGILSVTSPTEGPTAGLPRFRFRSELNKAAGRCARPAAVGLMRERQGTSNSIEAMISSTASAEVEPGS